MVCCRSIRSLDGSLNMTASGFVYMDAKPAAAAAFFFSCSALIIDIGGKALVWRGFLVYDCLVYILPILEDG